MVEVFIKFLKIFYDSTVLLSGVYFPTSHLALHQVLEMSEILHSYKDDVILKSAVEAMVKKFKKYWSGIPLLYALGCIVDPRTKLTCLKAFTQFIGRYLDLDLKILLTYTPRCSKFIVFMSAGHQSIEYVKERLDYCRHNINSYNNKLKEAKTENERHSLRASIVGTKAAENRWREILGTISKEKETFNSQKRRKLQ